MKVYQEYLAGLRARFGCAFVDLRERVPDEGFGDATHVSPAGAVWFSTLLVQEVLLPWWRQHHGEDYVEQGGPNRNVPRSLAAWPAITSVLAGPAAR
jgi:hypothetical protein